MSKSMFPSRKWTPARLKKFRATLKRKKLRAAIDTAFGPTLMDVPPSAHPVPLPQWVDGVKSRLIELEKTFNSLKAYLGL